MNSQVEVQHVINLHKPRKKVVSASWNQSGAQMNHIQQLSQDSP